MKPVLMPKTTYKPLRSYPIETRLKPFRHRLLVHVIPAPEETTTESGLIITRRAREAEVETTECGFIVASGKLCETELTPGTWVMLPRFSGTRVIHEHTGDPEADYRIIAEDCIMGLIDSEEVARKYGIS